MQCIKCNALTRVVNTRMISGHAKRRRRECMQCATRFTTYESLEKPDIPTMWEQRLIDDYQSFDDTQRNLLWDYIRLLRTVSTNQTG